MTNYKNTGFTRANYIGWLIQNFKHWDKQAEQADVYNENAIYDILFNYVKLLQDEGFSNEQLKALTQ